MQYFTDDKNYEFWLFNNDVLYLRYFDEFEVDSEVILNLMDTIFGANNDSPYYSIANLKNVYGKFSQEAKEIAGNHPKLVQLKKAEVLLADTLAIKLLIRGYFSIIKPKVPTKAFTNELEAIKWLKERGASEKGCNEFIQWFQQSELSV